MFSSIHSKRILKYFMTPKKFKVTLELCIGETESFHQIEVEAYKRNEAQQKAINELSKKIEIKVFSCNSMGKVKNLSEIKIK